MAKTQSSRPGAAPRRIACVLPGVRRAGAGPGAGPGAGTLSGHAAGAGSHQSLQRNRRGAQRGGRRRAAPRLRAERQSNDVYVIDPATMKVVDRFKVGLNPQHVVPSWDLKTLWVANGAAGSRAA